MSKLKNPLLSLDARNTLGESVTFARRRQVNIAEKKPIPTDPKTLAQIYQRWDYQDGIWAWKALSQAQKQVYQTAASRYHMTGFAYFMRGYLKNLPDLLGRWRLDEKTGAIAYDSSKNNHNGTIFGASPATGPIDGCYFFDGINDQIPIGIYPSLNPDSFTLELFIKPQAVLGWRTLFGNHWPAAPGARRGYGFRTSGATLRATVADGAGNEAVVFFFPLVADTLFHIAMTHELNVALSLYVDGDFVASTPITGITKGILPIIIGALPGVAEWAWGDIDNVVLREGVLPAGQIKQHSERRYPL